MIECLTVKTAHEDQLSQRQGVVGVGVGQKWVEGIPVDQPAVIVFVEKKRSKRGIAQKFSLGEVIPDVIDGIPTDIIEVGKIVLHKLHKQAAGFTQRVRPVKPGFSCGQRSVTAGTIGGFFLDKDGDPVILSNNHVLACENKAKIGDPIYQPGPFDAGSANLNFTGWNDPISDLPYIATLKRFVSMTKEGNVTDSAIAALHTRIVKAGLVDPLYPTINQTCVGFDTPMVGQSVQKCGRTTGYTTGRIIALNSTFTIAYDFGPAKFNDCVVLTGMSQGGDSGSLIMNMEMKGVAHLFAGSPKVTIANPIGYAVNEYGLKPWNIIGTTQPNVVGFAGSNWRQYTSGGKIEIDKNNVAILTGPANQFCYLEDNINKFKSVSITVNTGTDTGATWGPGITVQWPNGILKVNVRSGGRFGGYFNGTYNINLGSVKPNTDYTLRIRKSNNGTYIGEVQDGNNWFTVIEIPISVLPHNPVAVRIGKTDMTGQPSNHIEAGSTGSCTLRNFQFN